MKYLLILTFICLGTLSVYSQSKQIEREEYWQPYRSALQKGRSIDRRMTQKTEYYQDGKLISTDTWIYEYQLPDRVRYVNVQSEDGNDRRIEQINIGEVKYCKRDGAEWTISIGSCIGGGGFGGGSQPITEHYSVEEATVDGMLLTRYQSSTTQEGWSKDKRTRFSESTYWLDRDGRIVRVERRYGIASPHTVTRQEWETYAYEPNDLKIEAPINP